MFKPAYNANGCLTATLSNLSNSMQVSPAVASYISNLLGNSGNDWTYLKIGSDATGYEIVCVVGATLNTLIISTAGRGLDGTSPQTFATNTEFRYELTALAIADIVDDAATFPKSITANYPLSVTDDGSGGYLISIEPLNLMSANSSVILTGSYPNIDLAVNPNSFGCC